MKYSKNFERDYNWYLSVSGKFNFDGTKEYLSKSGENLIQVDLDNGKSAKECFYRFDSSGKVVKTKEPAELEKVLKTKGSVNLHIQMYAEDLFKGRLLPIELKDLFEEYSSPQWFKEAIRNQFLKLIRESRGRIEDFNLNDISGMDLRFIPALSLLEQN